MSLSFKAKLFCLSLFLPTFIFAKDFVVNDLKKLSVELTNVKAIHTLKTIQGTELKLVEVYFDGVMPVANLYLMTASRENIQKIWEIPTTVSSITSIKAEALVGEDLSTNIIITGTKLKNSVGPVFRNISINILIRENDHAYVVEGRTVTDKTIPWPSSELQGSIN